MNLAALSQINKALSAATAGAAGLVGTAAVEGGITGAEVWVIVLSALGVFFAAFLPRNTKPTEGE